MSLKHKIYLGFMLSSFIIAVLAAVEFINFVEIRKEIRFLEITDTIRSKSLQLRRHEKNFFLFSPAKSEEESAAVLSYIEQLNAVTSKSLPTGRSDDLFRLRNLTVEYRQRFNRILLLLDNIFGEFDREKVRYAKYSNFFPLIELTFYERPLEAAEFLRNAFQPPPDRRLISWLKELGSEIQLLRKNGEDILILSKDLDRSARDNVERVIHISQVAILIFFPLFFMTGIGALFFVGRNVVNRLNLLIETVEKTGKGSFPQVSVPPDRLGSDEVGVLISKFNEMEWQLSKSEEELLQTNRELLQTKKLAAIGTLASGVAHELNNPLNNIYISAQVLEKEVSEACSPTVIETLHDILSQTVRVKKIVGDLLDFARGREPVFRELELRELIMGACKLVSTTSNTEKVNFHFDIGAAPVIFYGDREQLERVFINLLANAVDAMSGTGDLNISAVKEGEAVTVRISDTGKGIPADAVEKIFEPFYTTKDKGTGLGLAIVFNIIKKHNGEIRAESEEGRGTTFTITLPTLKTVQNV